LGSKYIMTVSKTCREYREECGLKTQQRLSVDANKLRAEG